MKGAADGLLVIVLALAIGLWVFNASKGEVEERPAFVGPSSILTTAKSGNETTGKKWYEYLNLKKIKSDPVPEENRSIYRGLLSITRNNNSVRNSDAGKEFITLSYSANASSSITLTGFALESDVNKLGAFIPNAATELSSTTAGAAPLTLAPGESVVIVTGASPLGISFKETVCTGYLDAEVFVPSLSLMCPDATQSWQSYAAQKNVVDGDCDAEVATIETCEQFDAIPESVGNTCASFIKERLSYDACVATYSAVDGYDLGLWRVYLGLSKELYGNVRDTITLRDNEKKVVDFFSY